MGKLYEAYLDLKFLLNRGYRKKIALDFVSNHYNLPSEYRHFLARCVFSDDWIIRVREKLTSGNGKTVGVDGFNVLITLESLLEGRAIRCEDSLVRDLKYQGKYKFSEKTEYVVSKMLEGLKMLDPKEVIIFYGSQVPKSGIIKTLTKNIMERIKLKGDVKLARSPDFELKKFDYVVTSDVGIVEKAQGVIDVFTPLSKIIGRYPTEFREMLRILDERLK
ncbi:hypothetical protein PNA2_0336 [Pyrococcus sp. NA2]|uniref:DUF434 domain-containing protein n=1 Tax=Pyrococcus sp. (strain NA2) TaxID=342949 RepID=UPI000209A900|nr:DUF434 domain-containing protein [Pyrococcus sp. NA2]AEC51254.1 hypothetical protein PNA2_0336 [Pyrococcus sp. NA2]